MRHGLVLSALLATTCATTVSAENLFTRVDRNILVGLGVVGPAQYDQGEPKLMATLNITGFLRASEAFSVGGIGLAVRSTEDPLSYFFESDNFNEFGVAVPLATYRSGRKVAQVGVEIQRINFQKNLYYFAVGVGWNARRASADRTEQRPGTRPASR
jgi:hypothetical protein